MKHTARESDRRARAQMLVVRLLVHAPSLRRRHAQRGALRLGGEAGIVGGKIEEAASRRKHGASICVHHIRLPNKAHGQAIRSGGGIGSIGGGGGRCVSPAGKLRSHASVHWNDTVDDTMMHCRPPRVRTPHIDRVTAACAIVHEWKRLREGCVRMIVEKCGGRCGMRDRGVVERRARPRVPQAARAANRAWADRTGRHGRDGRETRGMPTRGDAARSQVPRSRCAPCPRLVTQSNLVTSPRPSTVCARRQSVGHGQQEEGKWTRCVLDLLRQCDGWIAAHQHGLRVPRLRRPGPPSLSRRCGSDTSGPVDDVPHMQAGVHRGDGRRFGARAVGDGARAPS